MRERLIIENPELALEWDDEKNKYLSLEQITAGSSKKVWWKCIRGHSWQASCHTRTKGCGCPYCYGRLAISGETDLKTLYPKIADEWDYENNGNLRPEQFAAASNKRVWWRCNLGHVWKTTISHRTNGTDCPYCTGNKVWAGFNDIATTHPHLLDDWDYKNNGKLQPEQFSAGSNKKVWWRCALEHSWNAPIYSRTGGHGCPYCTNLKALKGFNDLLSGDPTLCREWDYEKNAPLTPDKITLDSNKKVWWKCKNGHSWETCVSVRRKGCECPYCIGRRAIAGETDLKTLRPKVVAEWDYEQNGVLQPEGFTVYSNKRIWWKCALGHTWRTAISHRSSGEECPYCQGCKVWKGYNDLVTTHKHIADEWDYSNNKGQCPEQYSAGSNKRAWWICKLGHRWYTTICSRANGNNCPYCSNRRVLKGYNDLLSIDPTLSLQWNYEKNKLQPHEVVANSEKKVWWKCHRGHIWQAIIGSRRRGCAKKQSAGCPYCAGKLVITGETDLKTVCPKIASQWDYQKNGSIRPEKVTAQCNSKVWWICERGHSYSARISNRYHGRDCPYCTGKRPIVGETDLATVHPELLSEWDDEKNGSKRPEHYTASSNKKVWWKCKEFGHSWKTQIRDRHVGNNCPYCSGKTPLRTRLVK